MKYKVTENENVSTVFLDGEIDMDVADNVREVVFPLIDSGKEVHLNLKGVQYMDSSGISVIVESNQRAKEKNTKVELKDCLLYTSPSPRDVRSSRMPSSA